MMSYTRTLLLFTVLCISRTSYCYKLYRSESSFLCNNEILSEAKKNDLENNPIPKRGGFIYLPGDGLSSGEEREKRTFPASRYKYLTQTKLKGKMYQNSAKSGRQTKFTLSLDVPTNIMNILFNIAKAKNLRAKAAANARLMSQIGRRK
uniref:Urocortin 3 n=1 Tax=Acipenser dabryanus TaxID=62061 RepID=A0A6B9HBT3_ACIDA|nr:urocortin 3 precursor [Acipenser dabryanus]